MARLHWTATLAAALLLLVAGSSVGYIIEFEVPLLPEQLVPALETTSTAVGLAFVRVDTVNNVVDIEGRYTNLLSRLLPQPRGIQVYVAEFSRQGNPLYSLDVTDAGTREGAFSSTDGLTEDEVALLLGGAFYIQINTEGFPNGELRGQIVALRSDLFDTQLLATPTEVGGNEAPDNLPQQSISSGGGGGDEGGDSSENTGETSTGDSGNDQQGGGDQGGGDQGTGDQGGGDQGAGDQSGGDQGGGDQGGDGSLDAPV